MSSSQFVTQRLPRILLSAVVACLALPVSAAHAALPDLVSDPASVPRLGVYSVEGEQQLLLRFNSYIHNEGPGVLHIRGSGPAGGAMTSVVQVENGTETPLGPGGQMVFEDGNPTNEDGHDHWHLQRAAEYSLWDTGLTGQVAPANKVGFCLLDSEEIEGGARLATPINNCRPTTAGGPVNMGVSAGFRDLYTWNLPFQWVDVSTVEPGTYKLRSKVDPTDLIDEGVGANEDNGFGDVDVRIPGYRAKARSVGLGPVTIGLDADRVEPMSGTLAAPRYRVVTPPQHGTLDRTTGEWSTNRFVRYTPDDPADSQPDTFEYVVKASDSDFPRDAFVPRQTVSIGSGPGDVALSGAPQSMFTGTSAQLSATGGTSWWASRGSITPQGRFTAPSTPGQATVGVTDAGGNADYALIDVVAPPAPQPAPLPEGAPAGDPAGVPESPLALVAPARLPRRSIESAHAQRVGRFVAVTVRPGRSGTLRVLLRRNGRTIRSCRTRTSAGRSFSCRLRRPRTGRGVLRVVVELRRLDGKVVRQAVRISTARVH